VKVEREPVPLGDDRELPALLVEAGVDDRDRGVSGEHDDQLFVLVGEVVRADLLGQVEGPDHALRRHDRYAEEGAHVGMAAGPSATEAWMLVDVPRAVGSIRLEHRAEHSVLPRKRAERGDELVAHARGEEPPKAAVAVRKSERRVTCGGELASAVHEALQHVLDRELGRNREHGVADRFQSRAQPFRHLQGR
jgi:hypothetical protein